MTALGPAAVFFCLLSGCALGLLYLAFKALRVGFPNRALAFVLDVLFGLTAATAAFLTALAIDKGRLRFPQAALQLLGAWAAATALDPVAVRLGRALRWLCRCLRRLKGLFGGKRPLRTFQKLFPARKLRQNSQNGRGTRGKSPE